jgi:rhamnogalacturonyl hydrolase YesR
MPWLDGQAIGRRVLERILTTNPEELGWDWGAGLLGDAMGEWEDLPGVRSFLRKWVSRHERLGTGFEDKGGWHWKAGAGTTLLRLESWSPSKSRRHWIAELSKHVLNSPAGPDGIWLTKPDRHEIWIDTLATACPFLARAGAAGFGKEWPRKAAEQIIAHANFLQCEQSGLWLHAWSLAENRPMGRLWARGNGWAIHAMAEVLAITGTRREPRLAAILEKTCQGLLASQEPCGGWHTVLDDSSSYIETSGQALLVRGLAKAARMNLVPTRMRGALRDSASRGWLTVASHVSDSGEVTGTSLGTPAGSLRDYTERPVASWPVWGPASVLFAARERTPAA